MNKKLSADEERNLWVLFSQTRDAISKATKLEMRQYNITMQKGAVLFAVQSIGDKATPREVAKQLFRERHSIAELMIRMEKEGLIRRIHDLGKKNQWRAVLTEKGLQVHLKTAKRASLSRILATLSEEERECLRLSLHKLRNQALEELHIRPEMRYIPPGW